VAGLPLKLVVGLGNPGREYAQTRHNAGWWYLDALARLAAVSWQHSGRHQSEVARALIEGAELWLAKPATFMNRSGAAVSSIAGFYRIEPQEILIVHDDIDLPPGTVRLKQGGGHGGHNGLRDTIAHIGETFWRLRFGIGHPGNKAEVIDYVLTRAPRAEEDSILEAVSTAADCIPLLLEQGAERAMARLHSRAGKT